MSFARKMKRAKDEELKALIKQRRKDSRCEQAAKLRGPRGIMGGTTILGGRK